MSGQGDMKQVGVTSNDTAAPEFQLRPERESDFAFCEALYMDSMRPLLIALGAWDEEKATAAFKGYFKVEKIYIVVVGGADAGWLQVSETDDEMNLEQVHLLGEYRDLGIGTQLIRDTMAEAAAKGKPVLLSLVRGNRAVALYERLGFMPSGQDCTKIHMRWEGSDFSRE